MKERKSAEEKETLKKLQRIQKNELDKLFHAEHEKVFAKTDCLTCANCCKTTGPLFTTADISRLSKLFRMKPNAFIDQYLRVDEDNDHVLKSVPCPFLNEDNTCFVYEERPMACREYPHTNRKNMQQILSLTVTNEKVCPAVSEILSNIFVKIKA